MTFAGARRRLEKKLIFYILFQLHIYFRHQITHLKKKNIQKEHKTVSYLAIFEAFFNTNKNLINCTYKNCHIRTAIYQQ